MKTWIENLFDSQIKALACQCGLREWQTESVPSLKKALLFNRRAQEIYEEHYGPKTSVQGTT